VTIRDIVGDYKRTLADCEKLLDDHPKFRTSQDPISNLQWNLFVQPKVDHLRKRLQAHSSKIFLLLKPLELTLLNDVRHCLSKTHHDLAERINTVHKSVLQLQGLLIPDFAGAMSEQRQPMEIPVQVPEAIEMKFLAAAKRKRPEVRHPSQVPLSLAADSFHAHFEDSTKTFKEGPFLCDRTPPPEKYLNTLKCIWILTQIEGSDAFAEEQGREYSHWPRYIDKLREDLYQECQRFSAPSAQGLLAPDIDLLEESKYDIWIEEDLSTFVSPQVEKELPLILQITLPSPSESIWRQITIRQVNQSQYKLIETIEDTSRREKPPYLGEINIDLGKFAFLPLYATPSSQPRALQIRLDNSLSSITPDFQCIEDIYEIQHLLTGYEVHNGYDQAMVKVTFVISDQQELVEEHGRLQLWVPKEFANRTPNPSAGNLGSATMGSTANPRSHQSDRTPSQASRSITGTSLTDLPHLKSNWQSSTAANDECDYNGGMPFRRQSSLANVGSVSRRPTDQSNISSAGVLDLIPGNPMPPIPSHTRSSMSVTTVISPYSRETSLTLNTVTTFKTGDSSSARLHSMPLKPMLVVFLKSKDLPAKLSLVALQIDDLTKIERQRCDCRFPSRKCRTACIERTKGYLLAQRWNAGQDESKWNLAELGVEKRKDSENRWERVKRVSIKFEIEQGKELESKSIPACICACRNT
jgi:hypothetical protein